MSGIVFTRAWEDDRLDLAALAIRPGERVLAVAAAGDVPLAIAAAGAAEVVAVDLNVAQLRLTALKIAAAGLDADERYRWFEVGRVADPGRRFREVLRSGWNRRPRSSGTGTSACSRSISIGMPASSARLRGSGASRGCSCPVSPAGSRRSTTRPISRPGGDRMSGPGCSVR